LRDINSFIKTPNSNNCFDICSLKIIQNFSALLFTFFCRKFRDPPLAISSRNLDNTIYVSFTRVNSVA
tara:strand:- start:10340 stop:10543 length:204 start_codon:yes stop_codon:yes gene_type:complete